MPPHNPRSADILPFGQPTDAPGPRFVRPIPPEQLARAMGEPVRPGLLDRCADWLGSERGFGFAIGFYSGAMFTVAVALLIASTPMTFR